MVLERQVLKKICQHNDSSSLKLIKNHQSVKNRSVVLSEMKISNDKTIHKKYNFLWIIFKLVVRAQGLITFKTFFFTEQKWPIKVGADSTEGHCIKAMLSISMVEVLQARLSPDEC